MRHIRLRMLALGLAGALLLGALLLWGASQQWAANQFGYALAGPNGLPDHITYGGLRYDNLSRCGGASSCQAGGGKRWTQAELEASNLWPLVQVATIPTLFGDSHAVYTLVNDPGRVGAGADYTPLNLYVSANDGTYCLYERGGGP